MIRQSNLKKIVKSARQRNRTISVTLFFFFFQLLWCTKRGGITFSHFLHQHPEELMIFLERYFCFSLFTFHHLYLTISHITNLQNHQYSLYTIKYIYHYKSFIFYKLEILNDCMQSGLIDWHRYVTHFLLSEVIISVGKETSVHQANVEKTANIAVSRAMTVTSRFSGYISFARPHTAINVHWTYTQIYVRLFQTNIVLQSHATHTRMLLSRSNK